MPDQSRLTTPDPSPTTGSGSGSRLIDPTSTVHHVPPWFRRALLLVALTLLGTVAVFWLIQQLAGFIVTVVVAMFVGFAMEPAVNAMARRGVPRALGTIGVMLAVLALVVLFMWIIGALVVEQVDELIENLPGYVDQVTRFVQDHFDIDVTEQSEQLKSIGAGSVGGIAGNAFTIFSTLIGFVFQLFTIGLFAFYFCARGPELRRSICSALPPAQQRMTLRVWNLAIQKTAGYLYSRVLLGAASAIAHGICFEVLDMNYAVTLALWVGLVSQFIPTVGTYLAGALPILVALSQSPTDAIIVLVFVTVYQQFENYILTPPLSARTMELNPAVAFGAVIAGTTLLGIPGAFLALPLTATGTAFASAYIKRHELVEDESLGTRRDVEVSGDIDTPEEAEATLPEGR